MLNKLLATASAFGIVAGGASALDVVATNVAENDGDPILLAAELDYDSGDVAGSLSVEFSPTGAAFPGGNLTLFIEVSGAKFTQGLTGNEVSSSNGELDATISEGGTTGASEVSYVISGADVCDTEGPGDPPEEITCSIALPLTLDGDDVTISVGLETDAGQPVDNSASDNLVDELVVDVETAWAADFVADTDKPTATLASKFEAFKDDGNLGTINVRANSVENVVVKRDLAGNPVAAGDVESIVYTIGGSFVGIESLDISNTDDPALAAEADINEDETEATYEAGESLFGPSAELFTLVSNGETEGAIQRSGYTATVVITPKEGSPLASGATFSDDLASVVREGTQIVFPWSQSASQGSASGTNSVFRFGNLSSSDVDNVFVEAKNSSNGAYENPGIVELTGASIPAGGEFTTNSTQLEQALGNYGRADLEFTVEGLPDNLTGRQYVVRNGNLEQTIGGTIAQDLDTADTPS